MLFWVGGVWLEVVLGSISIVVGLHTGLWEVQECSKKFGYFTWAFRWALAGCCRRYSVLLRI